MNCRYCETKLEHVFCDLQTCPPSNSMISIEQLVNVEKYYPLKIFVCNSCKLVQVDELKKAEEIFNDQYTYYSSYSSTWLEHSKRYTNEMVAQFQLNEGSLVVEIASNDGYLLQYFKEKNIPVLGVEPTANTAMIAKEKGIDTLVEFFNSQLAQTKLKEKADLILGNNVLAHVPNINDFVKGVKIAMKPNGIATFEFPHLCKLIEFNQFDTIYHEHFAYLSLYTVKQIFENQGLVLFDVQELPTHGGSLRIFAKHFDDQSKEVLSSVNQLINIEKKLGIDSLFYYEGFQEKAYKIRDNFISFLIEQKNNKKKVIGFGAAAKGNTLLNFCGIKGNDLINFVVDSSPYKQGKFLPGSRIPVFSKEKIREFKPDFIIILPWNLQDEIMYQLDFVKTWGCKFVIVIPHLKTLN